MGKHVHCHFLPKNSVIYSTFNCYGSRVRFCRAYLHIAACKYMGGTYDHITGNSIIQHKPSAQHQQFLTNDNETILEPPFSERRNVTALKDCRAPLYIST
jgi:hypothetical protein